MSENLTKGTLDGYILTFTSDMGQRIDAMMYAWPVLMAGKTSTGKIVPVTLDADGNLQVDATITATAESTAEATAAAPTYTEGQDAPLSQDLKGNLRVKETGAASYANGQVSTSGTAATLLAARATRRRVIFRNLSSTAAEIVYIGAATVTAANGVPIYPGESVALAITTLIQAIAASGTPTVAYIEEYD